MFQYYMEDFGGTKEEVTKTILKYLPPTQRKYLHDCLTRQQDRHTMYFK